MAAWTLQRMPTMITTARKFEAVKQAWHSVFLSAIRRQEN